MNNSDKETLPIYLDRLERWAVGKAVKTNPGKSKAVSFTTAPVKSPLYYFLWEQRIPETTAPNI